MHQRSHPCAAQRYLRLGGFFACILAALTAAPARRGSTFDTFKQFERRCDALDATLPVALIGGVEQGQYLFTHITDVDVVEGVHRFHHILRNDNTTSYLPASWPKAGIIFDRIAAGGCGASRFETPASPDVDGSAPVLYGPGAQLQKLAALYIEGAATTRPASDAPALISHVSVKLEAGSAVDFRFRTSFADGVFRYEVQNHGTSDLLLRAPGLVDRWRQLEGSPQAQWPAADGGAFQLASRGWNQTHVYAVRPSSAPRAVTASLVQIELWLPTARGPVAKARISVYLPAAQ